MEEIQKSIQLINFSDSIFDQTTGEGEFGSDQYKRSTAVPMLKAKAKANVNNSDELAGKFVKFEDALKKYFSNEIDQDEEQFLKEILVCYWPFLTRSHGVNFRETIRTEREGVERIEWKCFGTVLREAERKEAEILDFYERTLGATGPIEEFSVLARGAWDFIDFRGSKFDSKRIAKTFSLMEAHEYVRTNPMEISSGHSEFIGLFNRFTNFLISSILHCDSREERKLTVKRILKVAKELREIGAMNSLKSCLAALECNSIHRLHVIDDQGVKYKKRYSSLSGLASPKGNYSSLRGSGSLLPWLGIFLKDFAVIKELAGESRDMINLTLSFCTRKLFNSITCARDSSIAFYQGESIEMRKQAALMKFCLKEQVVIEYETEEDQYNRSLAVSLNKN